MAHTVNEVVDAVVAGVNEGVFAIHNGHKSESRYIIKQNKFLVTCAWSVSPGWRGCTLSPRQNIAIWFIMFPPLPTCTTACIDMHYCLRLHALPPVPAVLTSCLTSPWRCRVVEDTLHRQRLPCRKFTPVSSFRCCLL